VPTAARANLPIRYPLGAQYLHMRISTGSNSRSSLCALLSFLSLNAQAAGSAEQAVTIGPAPEWARPSDPLETPSDASGLGFVRAQDIIVHLDATGQSTFFSRRIVVLHPTALQLGNIALAWNPAAGRPTAHALRIHRDGKTIDVLAGSAFEVLRREDQLEESILTGVLTGVLKVPDLRVGDELEVAYTLPSGEPTLGNASAGVMVLQGGQIPGRYHVGLSWEKGAEPRIRHSDDLAQALQQNANSLDIRVDNPPAISLPKDAPPRYAWQRFFEFSDYPDWAAVSTQFHALFAEAARLRADSPLRAEAARIAARYSSPAERAQAALSLVQDQVRYVFIGLNGGNYKPAGAEDTWQRRYGDCKAKTALLLALLSELGIPARAVLVQNSGLDDGIDQRLPLPGLFDHVLVNADIGGKTYWLDGTLPGVVEMRPTPFVPYRWVLPLVAKNGALWRAPRNSSPLPDEMGIFEIDARAGLNKPARKVSTTVKRGIAGVGEYVNLSALAADQLTTGMRSAVAGEGEWDTIDEVVYRYDRKTQASILKIVGSGPVDWEVDGDTRELALPGGGFSPPSKRQRPGDQDQSAPYYSPDSYSCYATTLRVPDGTDLDHWGFNSTYDVMMFGHIYYRMMEKRVDHTLRMVRGSRTELNEITAEAAKRDNQRIEKFDNSKANITYDPARTMKPWGKLTPVPATYEIDWAGADIPCLPADALKAH
jgi:transglutaminase-like putative cysteine protease